MEPKTFTDLNDVRKLIDEFSYSYLLLTDAKGTQLIPRNPLKGTVETKWKQIKKRLESDSTPVGVYKIGVSTSTNKKPEFLLFIKGDISPDEITKATTIVINEAPKKTLAENVLTYEQALNYQNEIATLKAENIRLQNENDNLQAIIEEYEEEEEEEQETLKENEKTTGWQKTIETIGNAMTSVIEKHYETKRDQLRMELLKMGYQVPEMQKVAGPQNTPDDSLRDKIDKWLDNVLQKEQVDIYNDLAEMVPTTNSFNEWLGKFKEKHPEVFGVMCQQLNLKMAA